MRILKLNMIAFFSMMILFSCSNDSDEILLDEESVTSANLSVNRNNDPTIQFKSLLNELFVENEQNINELNISVSDTQEELINPTESLLNITSDQRLIGTSSMQIYSEESGLLTINTISVETGRNKISSYVEVHNRWGDYIISEVSMITNNEDQLVIDDGRVLETVIGTSDDIDFDHIPQRNWFSDYAGCLSDVASIPAVTILGVLGPVCGPCGIAGAVIFGFGALGCLAV